MSSKTRYKLCFMQEVWLEKNSHNRKVIYDYHKCLNDNIIRYVTYKIFISNPLCSRIHYNLLFEVVSFLTTPVGADTTLLYPHQLVQIQQGCIYTSWCRFNKVVHHNINNHLDNFGCFDRNFEEKVNFLGIHYFKLRPELLNIFICYRHYYI